MLTQLLLSIRKFWKYFTYNLRWISRFYINSIHSTSQNRPEISTKLSVFGIQFASTCSTTAYVVVPRAEAILLLDREKIHSTQFLRNHRRVNRLGVKWSRNGGKQRQSWELKTPKKFFSLDATSAFLCVNRFSSVITIINIRIISIHFSREKEIIWKFPKKKIRTVYPER